MKSFAYIFLTFLIVSCTATKPTSTGFNKRTLKGTWQVTNIRFVGDKGLYKAHLFDLADSACFNKSTWVFIPNNGSGKFSLNGGGQCTASTNFIHWSFYEGNGGGTQLQFKYVDAKKKVLDPANTGYRSKIDQLSPNNMVVRIATTYEGNPFDVVMTLNKVSENITL